MSSASNERVEPDLDLQPGQLALVPVEEIEDLRRGAAACRRGGTGRRGRPTASARVTRWPRSAATRAASSPATPPPTTSTRLGPRRRREAVAAPFEFAPGRRIDQAGDPVVAIAAAPAHLVAGEAGPDVFGAAVARLVGEMRIGDLAAHDRDHVGLARGDDIVGILRRADMAFGLHPGMAAPPASAPRHRGRRACRRRRQLGMMPVKSK